ncbi:MAG: ATP-binding protein, partial [Planctomycetota bacterium]
MRSLVALTLLLVGGVVLAPGAGVVSWITTEDRREARADADRLTDASERELVALSEDLVRNARETGAVLVKRADRRLREWLAVEPLSLYRDARPPHPLDVKALREGLTSGASARSLTTEEHLRIVRDAMDTRAAKQVAAAVAKLRAEAGEYARAAIEARQRRLVLRLGLLLAGMAMLLAGTLAWLVIAPVGRIRGAVDRIASGDLASPVPARGWPTREMDALARDVDRMREQIRVATEGLESEVERKTRTLAATLAERTEALQALEAARDRLVQAEKMAGLGTLAGGVAHEFNNLLGGILGCLESARAGTDAPSVLEDLDMARRTALRATNLVDALLGVARPGERTFAPVALGPVVDDVLTAAAATTRRRRIEVGREIEADPVVEGDEGQLHQVVLNLVTNAIQAVADGERITVAVRIEGLQAILEVRDSGPGVPAEMRSRIFEPFFTGRREGTGLGLFVSYGIVERHGGRVEVGEAVPEGGARV